MNVHIFSPEQQDRKSMALVPTGRVAEDIVRNYMRRRNEIFGQDREINADSYARHAVLLKDTAHTLGISPEEFIAKVYSEKARQEKYSYSPLTHNISSETGSMRRDICEGYNV